MVVVDGQGIPLGNYLDSASPAEVKLVDKTLRQVRVPRRGCGRPKSKLRRLIADRAYDSDPLRKELRARGIELICPHRSVAKNLPRKRVVRCVAIANVGKSNVPLPGWDTSGA